jgi:hypothetical protein
MSKMHATWRIKGVLKLQRSATTATLEILTEQFGSFEFHRGLQLCQVGTLLVFGNN